MKSVARTHNLEVTTPSDREIVMTRVFDARAQIVFDAFTKPELLQRWLLGPDGWSMPTCEVDLKDGGAFRYIWRNDTDGREFGVAGVYREVRRPERIVHTEHFEGAMQMDDALVTTRFAEQGGATTMTLTILYDSKATRDTALESGMETGVAASYDRLATLLTQPAA